MDRAKPARRSRNKPESAAETLDQIESAGDRFAQWIGDNAKAVVVIAVVLLVAAASYAFWEAARAESSEAASVALAKAQHGFRRDMGTGPNELLLAEPANATTAGAVRRQYLTRFQEVADQFSGTPEGGLAELEVGNLELALGDLDAARAAWSRVAADGPGPTLRGLGLTRVAWAYEQDSRWPEAAAKYREAGDLTENPFRRFALADAARCYVEAGDTAQARQVAEQLERLSGPGASLLPDNLRAQIAELQNIPETR